jgi:ATP-dependent exoDNAse (exonuclease V) alpha subunit
VAIYHLSVKTISRSAGRSATAAAAYRAGVEITDERTGEIHDYTRKGGVESAELVLPAGAPEWAADRAALWNAAEQAETRKNSTVAREFEIALPEELSPAERARLARDFARELVERHGCAADVCIHAPGKDGDDRNHHAHILLTTRRLGPEGLTEKTRELDDQKTGSKLVTQWRERFAALTNERLRENGIEARVDHRTLEAQGIEREPTRHLGPAATAIERRTGQPSHKRQQHNEDALERLQRAREAGELERQGKEAERSIIDLSGDLEAAKLERSERQRIERMNSNELAAEIRRIRPSPVASLVERDQAVIAARDLVEQLSAQQERGQQQEARSKEQAEQWREQHQVQAWFHDKGIGHAPKLRELEEQREAGRTQWLAAVPHLQDAILSKRNVEQDARERIRFEQASALLKVDELEALRQEKVRQEFEQQTRQDENEKKVEPRHDRGMEL